MEMNSTLSLKEAQSKSKMDKTNFHRWIKSERIPLYFKVPDGKGTFIASRRFLDLLIRGATAAELRLHNLSGGIEQAEAAQGIGWLRIPVSEYQTLFTSNHCHLHYFSEGLQPSKDGLKTVKPQFGKQQISGLEQLAFDAIYCLTNKITSPPELQFISLDEVYIQSETLNSPTRNTSNLIIPQYRYASKKLEIALQVWSDIWKKDYEIINDKALTERKILDKIKTKSCIAAKNELEKIYCSENYTGEKYQNLHIAISEIIRPEFTKDHSTQWFVSPISRGIFAMIDASNYFWADLDIKQYGINLGREEIVDFLINKHHLKATVAEKATRIIQPDNITRGRKSKFQAIK